MRKIEKEELKKVQMDILTAVDKFCSEHNIRYSMSCGTLLGAIRHGGYIPWDDDIDIYMLREDFNRFERIFPNVLDGKYILGSLNRDNKWCIPFAKIYDNRTIVKEMRSKSPTPGVNIDVFPIDDVTDNEEEWGAYNKTRRQYILNLRHSLLTFSPINSFAKNCGAFIYMIKYIFTSPRKLAEKCDRIAQINNGKGYKRVFETSLGMVAKRPFEKKLFDILLNIKFEDREFKGFAQFHEFLTQMYGDYETPPPVNKRESDHTIDAYWKD